MELLKYVHGENVNPLRMKNIYDTWISRTSSRKDVPIEVFVRLFFCLLLYELDYFMCSCVHDFSNILYIPQHRRVHIL